MIATALYEAPARLPEPRQGMMRPWLAKNARYTPPHCPQPPEIVHVTDWYHEILRIKQRTPVFPLIGAAVLLCALAVIGVYSYPTTDIAGYYGPLTAEFATGNYQASVYHSIPPLVPILAGIVAKTGLGSFTALKIVSTLFFLAGAIPMYRISKRLVPTIAPEWSVALYLVCPRLFRYGTGGGVDGAKFFLLLICVERLMSYVETPRYRTLGHAALFIAALSLCRAEGVLYLPLFMIIIAAAHWHGRTHLGQMVVDSTRSIAVVLGLTLLLCCPWLIYQYTTTGWPALDSRQAWKMRQILAMTGVTEAPPPLFAVPEQCTYQPAEVLTLARNLKEGLKGMFPPFLVLSLIGLLYQWRKRTVHSTKLTVIAIAVVMYNIVLFTGIGYVAKRYAAAGIPFLLPWVPVTAILAYNWMERHWSRSMHPALRPRIVISALVIVICLWDSTGKARGSYRSHRRTIQQDAKQIAAQRQALNINRYPPLTSARWGVEYHNGRELVIAATFPQISYLSDSDWYGINSDYVWPYDALVAECAKHHVDVLVLDPVLEACCSEFSTRNAHFSPIANINAQSSGIITYYTFHPKGVAQ